MPRLSGRGKRGLCVAVCVALVATWSSASTAPPVRAVSPNVVISQVYGGGGNSGSGSSPSGVYTNDFVELFNRGTETISVAGWSIQYASATGAGNFGANSGQLTPLSGSLAPGHYLLVQEAAGSIVIAPLPTADVTDSTPINMSATGGKVALVNTTTGLGCNGGSTPCSPAQLAQIVDLVGWDGANFFETAPAPATTNATAVLRKSGGAQDTDNNSADFEAGPPTPRNSTWPFGAAGTASPAVLLAGDSTLLTVAVTPGTDPASTGTTVSCVLSAIGDAGSTFYDDGTHGDVTAGDNTFSYLATVASNTVVGAETLPCTVSDAQGRTASTSIGLSVVELMPIGSVNGPVPDASTCAAHASPYVGQTVAMQGVIYETTLQAIGGTTDTYKGFYIQNTSATADSDPTTSDGIFVFMNKQATVGGLASPYAPAVGDEVVLAGTVSEFHEMTELVGPLTILQVVQGGVDIEEAIPPVVADPPVDLSEANCYWERLQGMRVQVPEQSVVLGGRNVFNPADAEIWVAPPGSTIAQRADPYERRAFRDAHPLDDNYNAMTWDGNGYRILMGSLGIKAASGDAQALIDSGRTFDTVTNAPSGGLNYTFNKYRIEVSEQPTFNQGVDPAANHAPAPVDRSFQYSIVDYNLENLYDYRDNPFSGCDFNNASNPKCSKAGTPFLTDVTGAYDYVPASDAAYQARLTDIATQINTDLHDPDILMVQEVENQDICTVTDGALACGATDNADGKPDVLQELALKVATLGGPAYDATFDRDSSDLRGIAPAFLYRTDRVELLPAAGDPILGSNPAIGTYTPVAYDSDVSNPKTLNAQLPAGITACETSWVFPRAPDIGLFRIWSASVNVGTTTDVYLVNNHFKSGPDSCVAHRTEQAKYNAALVDYLQTARPDARIVLGGDLNVYPRPDDPFGPTGQAGSSDQLGSLYDPNLGLTNLWDVLLAQAPEAAYSYVYLGQAQTLDQLFVNAPMLASLGQFRIAHINSDFAADDPGDVARGTSDHDPNAGTFVLTFPFSGFLSPVDAEPMINVAKAGQSIPVKFSLGGDRGLDIFASGPTVSPFACPNTAVLDAIEATVSGGSSSLHYDALTDQYIYTWRTTKSMAGTCQRFSFVLIDGTSHEALFKFTK